MTDTIPEFTDAEVLSEINHLLFGEDVEAFTTLEGVQAVVASEKRLRKALRRLLDARVAGTVRDQDKAQQKGAQALEEAFAAQREAGDVLQSKPCLDPNKMHGAAEGFGGSDFPDFD